MSNLGRQTFCSIFKLEVMRRPCQCSQGSGVYVCQRNKNPSTSNLLHQCKFLDEERCRQKYNFVVRPLVNIYRCIARKQVLAQGRQLVNQGSEPKESEKGIISACRPLLMSHKMSLVMRKLAFVICEQQRRRLACASAQSDQNPCCSLPGKYNTSTCYSRNFKSLASLCGCAGRFESYLVENSEDRFSRDEAQMIYTNKCIHKVEMYIYLRTKGSARML